MATFLLVHGACHGGWCWDSVAADLRRQGHTVLTPDLPSDDPAAGLEDYARVASAGLESGAGDVVLVGHSLGALTVPIVAAQRPVSTMVFVAGIVGMPGKSLADLAEVDAGRDGTLEDGELQMLDNGTFVFTEAGARRALYHDCDPDAALAAIRRLRPQRSLWNEVMTIDRWPDTRIESVVCTEDRMVNRSWAERTATERLGTKPILMECGHSPMLARPGELAGILAGLAH